MTEGEREEGVSQLKLWHVYNKAAKWPLLAPPLSRISMWNPAGRPRRPNFQVRADSKVFLWNKPSQGNVPTFKWHLTFGFHIICKAFMTSCGLCVPWTPRKPFSFCKAFELKLFYFGLGWMFDVMYAFVFYVSLNFLYINILTCEALCERCYTKKMYFTLMGIKRSSREISWFEWLHFCTKTFNCPHLPFNLIPTILMPFIKSSSVQVLDLQSVDPTLHS